jgi:hypothetical protein
MQLAPGENVLFLILLQRPTCKMFAAFTLQNV